MYTIERQWEEAMIDRGISKYFAQVDAARFRETEDGSKVAAKNESSTSYGQAMLRTVFESYEEAIKYFTQQSVESRGKVNTAALYLAGCDTREVAYLAGRAIIDSVSRKAHLTSVAMRITGHIEDHMRFASFDATHPMYYKAVETRLKKDHVNDYRTRRRAFVSCHNKAADPAVAEAAARKRAARLGMTASETNDAVAEAVTSCDGASWVPWPDADRLRLGVTLIDLFILATGEYINGESAVNNCYQFENMIPGTGFIERVLVSSGRTSKKNMVVPTKYAEEFIKANMNICASLHPEYLPTLIPPKPWSTPYNGGYWHPEMRKRRPLVKAGKEHLRLLENAFMPDVYEAVNAAQATAWQINEFVLNEALAQWNKPHGGVGMSDRLPIEIPENPLGDLEQGDMNDKEFRRYKKAVRGSLTPDEKAAYAKWCNTKREIILKDNERKAKRLGIESALRVGRMLAKEQEFYYVHTLDYRGRFYPCGTGVNPQGADLSKGLLRFKEGTPLGKYGFWHICLHAAGVYGVDKVPLEDRVSWVFNHKQEIIRTGLDPAETEQFWGGADKPYMFLAVCQELAEVFMMHPAPVVNNCYQGEFTNYASGYMSHLSGNQDGSCNGIQHFSAMLLDPVGAKAVNLLAQLRGCKPEDIYTETADHVVKELVEDLRKGLIRNGKVKIKADGRLNRLMRHVLEVIDRKATKRSTMIVPYGGTKRSCLKHVKDWVVEINDKNAIGWNAYDVYDIALPLHHYIWHALDTVVVAARKAMQFLRDLIKVNCKLNVPMIWTTPTGFIARQDIKATKDSEVVLKMFGRIRVTYKEETDDLNKNKMATSFPPNFVHSMDASHMVFTVVKALDLGITNFSLVHDSFGVPFGQVEPFHAIIRETFCDIYQHNVLIGLKRQMQAQFPHMEHDMPADSDVERGNYDIQEVKQSIHFFR
jgi:DNA-directed RNA polymerase